ncbi:MAG: nucleoside-diphosphate sugar epimerase/dehydratase [Coriobacteriia bacterium]|jgi:FlaA1/EpsC-like NDP-sugar epimerase|nr:nucleoside-diphosphate sugar epimerase/dehydratase [Coriobacteriia bacterium]
MLPATLRERLRETSRLSNTALLPIDAAVVVMATITAYYARFEGMVLDPFLQWMVPVTLLSIFLYATAFAFFGLYRLVLRYVGVDTLLKLGGAVVVVFGLLLTLNLVMPLEENMRPVPLSILFYQAILVFLGASAARMAARVFIHLHASLPGRGRRVLIVGAGDAGPLLLRDIQNQPDLGYSVVGFLDDDSAMLGRTIMGVPVAGLTEDLAEVVSRLGAQEVIVAMPQAPHETIRRILNAAADAGVQTRVMPQLVTDRGSVSLRDVRHIDVADLLGRQPTPIDIDQVRESIAVKSVAVTGAAGSVGSELCRQLLPLGPRQLVLVDVDEARLHELWLQLHRIAPDVAVIAVCDIRDARRLDAVFGETHPDLVFHCAAYKHVPIMESAPEEAVKTNVLGTARVLDSCVRNDVRRFVLASTDKAVAPTNMVGLTEALAETLTLDSVRRGLINACIVRFGNVLGSRGSVTNVFQDQLRRGGPLTVTDPRVTRHFMTASEAARLILQAQAIAEPGDTFVLRAGEPVSIEDLARKIIALSGVPAEIEFVGLRPGEKLHDELAEPTEGLLSTGRENILRIERPEGSGAWSAEDVMAVIEAAVRGSADDVRAAIAHLCPGFGDKACKPW